MTQTRTKFQDMAKKYISELPEHVRPYATALVGTYTNVSAPHGVEAGTSIGERVDVIRDVYLISKAAGALDVQAGDDGSRARYQGTDYQRGPKGLV